MTRVVLALFLIGSWLNAEPIKSEALRQELLRREREDQDARIAIMSLFDGSGQLKNVERFEKLKEGELPEVIRRGREIDRRNTARMKEIVDEYGWPGKSLVGGDGAQSAWLLVQHADEDVAFQKRCLKLLEQAVKNGEASGQNLAYLTDRVRVAGKEKQVYGTQLLPKDGKLVPQPIEDEAHVDERRKEVGLEPLAEYVKSAEAAYAGQLKPKP